MCGDIAGDGGTTTRRRHRNMPLACEPGQEGLNLDLTHAARMAQTVMPHERANPVDIGLLGA